MQVIINADDLGISPEVNEVTFDLMAQGLVTSATLLANAPFVTEAVAGSKRFPSCSFGVHLNLTEFQPLSPHEGLKDLLGKDGCFSGALDRDPKRVKRTGRLLSAMADEWCHQIDFLRGAGVQISHLDSHQHVHTIPLVFPVLKYIQAKYGIRKVRTTRNVYRKGASPSSASQRAKQAYHFSLSNLYATKTTDVFMDFTTFYERAVVGGEQWHSVEVMVHPGSEESREENELFASSHSVVLSGRMRLISYNEL